MKLARITTTVVLAASALGLALTGASSAGASSAGASSAGASAAAAAPATQQIVVRPVHSNGHPVAGYAVTTEKISDFSCDEGTSPVAVDPGIRFCGFSATYTVACWKSTDHTVLCLRNPHKQALVRIRYVGSFAHVAAPKRATPEALRLDNAALCSVRDGGAWGTVKQHPSWAGDFACPKGEVYGPQSGDGINRSHPAWTVRTFGGSLKGPGSVHTVKKAYYVGTAS